MFVFRRSNCVFTMSAAVIAGSTVVTSFCLGTIVCGKARRKIEENINDRSKARVASILAGVMENSERLKSLEFNDLLEDMYRTHGTIPQTRFYDLLALHPEYKTKEDLEEAVDWDKLSQFDQFGTVQQVANSINEMKTLDFLDCLTKCLKEKNESDDENGNDNGYGKGTEFTYRCGGAYYRTALDAAKCRFHARTRECACGNPYAGVESSIHSINGCYP